MLNAAQDTDSKQERAGKMREIIFGGMKDLEDSKSC